jgi:hypothetical protein
VGRSIRIKSPGRLSTFAVGLSNHRQHRFMCLLEERLGRPESQCCVAQVSSGPRKGMEQRDMCVCLRMIYSKFRFLRTHEKDRPTFVDFELVRLPKRHRYCDMVFVRDGLSNEHFRKSERRASMFPIAISQRLRLHSSSGHVVAGAPRCS